LNRNLILAIDIGTSSVRAALYDHSGNLLPRSLVKNERQLTGTSDGGSEIDADKAMSQVVEVIDQLLAASESVKGEITHVATCAFWHSLVGVDADGKPTTRVLSWADNRSRDHVTILRNKLNEIEVHSRTGARFHSSFWPAKLLWFRKAQPDIFARTAMWLSLSDLLAMKLFGDPTTSVSMASATGIFDIRKCEWDKPLLKFLKIKATTLPTIAESSQNFRLNKKFTKRWSRLADAEWFAAIGDGAANNIGSGCATKSNAGLMIGTSGAMRVAYRGEPPAMIPAGLWCYRIDRKRVIVGGALSDGGGLYSWIKENLHLPSNIESALQKREPDQHGLTFLPFLAGERSTGYHENATGAIIGLNASSTAIDIAQAAMESVAYRFAEILDQLDTVTKIDEIVASGGALRSSKIWTQIMADVLGRKITLADAPEASLRGAVLLALETIGNIESIEKAFSRSGDLIPPNSKKHSLYVKARCRHKEAYDREIR